MWCTMDSLSLSLVILVFFIPLLAFFATVKQNDSEDAAQPAKTLPHEHLHAGFARLQRPRSRSESRVRDCAPVLRQNVAVTRLMRLEGMPLI